MLGPGLRLLKQALQTVPSPFPSPPPTAGGAPASGGASAPPAGLLSRWNLNRSPAPMGGLCRAPQSGG